MPLVLLDRGATAVEKAINLCCAGDFLAIWVLIVSNPLFATLSKHR